MTTELAAIRAELAELRAEVAALRPRPVKSWRSVAAVLGVSEDTVARRRRERPDLDQQPMFRDADGVREWWAELHVPAPTVPRRGKPRRAAGGGVFDGNAVLRERLAER